MGVSGNDYSWHVYLKHENEFQTKNNSKQVNCAWNVFLSKICLVLNKMFICLSDLEKGHCEVQGQTLLWPYSHVCSLWRLQISINQNTSVPKQDLSIGWQCPWEGKSACDSQMNRQFDMVMTYNIHNNPYFCLSFTNTKGITIPWFYFSWKKNNKRLKIVMFLLWNSVLINKTCTITEI